MADIRKPIIHCQSIQGKEISMYHALISVYFYEWSSEKQQGFSLSVNFSHKRNDLFTRTSGTRCRDTYTLVQQLKKASVMFNDKRRRRRERGEKESTVKRSLSSMLLL